MSFPDKIEVPEENETVEICTSLHSEGRLESDLIITLNISDDIAGKVIDIKYMSTFSNLICGFNLHYIIIFQ